MPSSVCTVCASHAALVLVLMSVLPAPSEQSNAVLDAIQHHLPSHCDDKHDEAGEGHVRITPGGPIRGMVHHKWWSDCIMATIAGSDSMQWPLYQHINALLNEDHIKGTSGKQMTMKERCKLTLLDLPNTPLARPLLLPHPTRKYAPEQY